MIAYLKGNFNSKTPSSVIVDVNGVGYDVNISLNTYSQIQSLESGLLFTHLLIKEDAHLLYGFADVSEKNLFVSLISVSGIGAGTARLILSYMKPEEIVNNILTNNSNAFEKIKGIGKKTAERVVLELRDKLGKQTTEISLPVDKNISLKADAMNALTALGINKIQADQAVNKILQSEPQISLEDLIKKVLKGI
ncbi:MAG TPA: Holliday junction branch migration protein RuvA [Niabella sp.]|nr:Holliday junction branch migration protein RuvA [Chitinophagaceae bacterium]HRN47844.1 Holliday junction branch migration protein RuvA [Niabella sp.]HUN03329.1 Holliday junction branch migration protein RuvA [Niabella sp.]